VSLLVVGLSHRSAPIALLERVALDGAGAQRLAVAACQTGAAGEAVVLATCNRVELYADVDSFHAGVRDLSAAIAERTGVPLEELCEHLYFHHGDSAVTHLFTVASGLDSMAVGESQVLGQVRAALRRGQEDGTAGRTLDHLLQQALRVVGAEAVVGDLAGARALVVGAGSMSALAATTLHRRGLGSITVVNRTPERAERLAEAVGGSWVPLDEASLRAALADADVVVSCTGAVGHVLGTELVAAARTERAGRAGRADGAAAPQLVVDLALPHDVDPAVGALDGVVLVGLAQLRERFVDEAATSGTGVAADVRAARGVVEQEVRGYLAEQRSAAVGPAVAALRSLARDVVDAELGRLRSRLGTGADPRVAAEAELTVHRVVEKLLHTPTVRVKALAAGSGDGASWASALRQLFDLDGGTGPDTGGLLGDGPAPGPVGALGTSEVVTGGTVAEVLRAVPAAAGTPEAGAR
jgi:glutamyl-tRNA reductase